MHAPRPQRVALPLRRVLVHRAAAVEHDPIALLGLFGADVAEPHIAADALGTALQRISVPAAPRRLLADDVAGPELEARDLARHRGWLDDLSAANHREAVGRAVRAAVDTVGRDHVLLRDDGEHRLVAGEAHLPAHAEAAPEPPVPARPLAQLAPLDPERVPAFDDLRGVERAEVPLGVEVHRVVAVHPLGAAGAARRPLVKEVDAVPARLRPRDVGVVGAALVVADLHVRDRLAEGPRDDRVEQVLHLGHGPARRGVAGVDEAALGRDHRAGRERAVVDGRRRVQERLDDGAEGIERHRRPDVGGARGLRRRPREIGDDLVAVDGELELRDELLGGRSGALDVAFAVVDAILQLPDVGPHLRLRAANQLLHPVEELAAAESPEQSLDVVRRLAGGAHHGVEVADALRPGAHVVEHELQERLVHLAAVADPGRRDADPLLDHLVHPARQTARRHPADIAPVSAHGREHRRLPFVEDGVQHEDVVEMGAAGVGIVVEEDVAFVDVPRERLRHHAGRVRNGEDVDRVVVERLRDLAAVRGHQTAGEVVALVEDGRVRGVDHVRPHLVDHRDERLADQLELHQVLHRRSPRNHRIRSRQLIPKHPSPPHACPDRATIRGTPGAMRRPLSPMTMAAEVGTGKPGASSSFPCRSFAAGAGRCEGVERRADGQAG